MLGRVTLAHQVPLLATWAVALTAVVVLAEFPTVSWMVTPSSPAIGMAKIALDS
jgi:hypothetical protein